MSSRNDIIQLINLYGFAVDTQRWDLFDQIFTGDADADFGGSAHWRGLEQWKSDFAAFHAPFDATQHVMTNHQVRVSGESAHSFTYGQWRLLRHTAEGGSLWDGSGWYDDEWVKVRDGWRCRKRVCRVVWSTGNDRVKETIPGVTFENVFDSMKAEAAAGSLSFLKAIDAQG